ncbi:protein of unknown function [Paraoerskovia marina]|uniref:DUF4188 domain-containing protein n=1 Tax=Paraoerskovia marina TaxID=545619 RepID=A0A1H1NSQ0_9CELL|nr:DUF4188 domain-containing protein [Paraoerskovia marina]SDS02011.1 protein of unknown function [Paraoerskovia marina]
MPARAVHTGRWTTGPAEQSNAGAMLLIGMRANTLRGLLRARRVGRAMGAMQAELHAHPETGFLSGENWFARTTILVSYWRDVAAVQAYASQPDGLHLPAWREYVRLIGATRDLGVWHELYDLRSGGSEAVYVNMPRFGRANADGHREVAAGLNTSSQRMRA